MALPSRRLVENVPGEFFVDATCIDCDACRQIAPATFRDHGGQSSVFAQPVGPDERRRAFLALVACPTASIGASDPHGVRMAARSFPVSVTDNVLFCGYTSEKSLGAWAYLIQRPPDRGGNILVDSPRFAAPLVRRLESLGGLSAVVLSHRDDIADHVKFAAHFGCPRVMHEEDGAARLGIERVVCGTSPVPLDDELIVIPTPGHTRGHQVLLFDDRVLFSGDHLAWSETRRTLTAFRDHCWYSWGEQTRSMRRLLRYRFEWVLPGHGRQVHASAAIMHEQLQRCVVWMETVARR